MKKNKTDTIMKIYTLLGKGLFACATGSIGLVLGGPFLALAGVFIGVVCGEILEKSVTLLTKFN